MEPEDATMLGAGASLRAPAGAGGPMSSGPQYGDAPDDDMAEIEHEGQVYRVPSPLQGAFLMNADYTRKSRELAQHRQALEAQRKAFLEHAERTQATAVERAQLAAIDHELDEFQAIDWELLASEDPQTAQALWAKGQELARAREQYAFRITHQEHQGRVQAEQEMAAQLVETGRVLSREIEGWSPEVAAKLVEYAGAFGVTLDELREIADPRLWKILHRAHQGEQLSQQQSAARNLAQSQSVRPAVQVSGMTPADGAARDSVATADWIRRRNEQMRVSR
jgi:hypothetical protein